MDRLLSQNDYATLEERGENDEPLPDWGIQFSGAQRVWSGDHESYVETEARTETEHIEVPDGRQ